jgi:hypothetical protein
MIKYATITITVIKLVLVSFLLLPLYVTRRFFKHWAKRRTRKQSASRWWRALN